MAQAAAQSRVRDNVFAQGCSGGNDDGPRDDQNGDGDYNDDDRILRLPSLHNRMQKMQKQLV